MKGETTVKNSQNVSQSKQNKTLILCKFVLKYTRQRMRDGGFIVSSEIAYHMKSDYTFQLNWFNFNISNNNKYNMLFHSRNMIDKYIKLYAIQLLLWYIYNPPKHPSWLVCAKQLLIYSRVYFEIAISIFIQEIVGKYSDKLKFHRGQHGYSVTRPVMMWTWSLHHVDWHTLKTYFQSFPHEDAEGFFFNLSPMRTPRGLIREYVLRIPRMS